MTARHIVIEGGDGSGKSTQAGLLADHLRTRGIDVEQFPEPGKSGLELPIRELMLNPDMDYDDKTRLFLVNAARVETAKRIGETLARGVWAISDRSLISSIAMQGHAEGLDLETVRRISEFAAGEDWQPDITIVLSAPTEVLRARSDARGTKDAYENKDDDYHERVNSGYAVEAQRLGAIVIDAVGTETDVQERIWQVVEPLTKN